MFAAAPSPYLMQMKAGKATLAGTTVTADPKKGLLALRKSEDQLMHLIWKERESGNVVDDLIVFEGDAKLKHLEQCKDGFAMLLEFSQTERKLFFWSQEPRKKGADFSDTTKEKELLEKANGILTGGSASAPVPAGAAGAAGVAGALGMTHNELMAMLGGAMPAAALGGAAPGGAAPAAAGGAPAPAAFSADAISSILGNIAVPPAAGDAAAPAAAAPAAAAPAAAPSGEEKAEESGDKAEPMDES